MAPLLTTTTLLSLLFALTSAQLRLDVQKNFDAQNKQLKARQLQRRSLSERADSISVGLTNDEVEGLYFANITVGTPGQTLGVQIDTGSSDVWVPSSTARICQDVREGGCPLGSFIQSKSSTFDDVEPNGFNISYVDGTGSLGDYFQDTFSIGGATIKNFEMGLALSTSIGVGIMGIGYNTSEANIDTGNRTEYPNLPISMVKNGLINSAAYSLWLNDLQATSGSILFGAVDTAKYSGDLISVNVYPDEVGGPVTSFTVAFTSLSATSSSGTDQFTSSNYASPAILDSGTTITLLPDDIARTVFEELGAEESEQLGAVVVPCALAQNTGTLKYQFGGAEGPIIEVAMSQLVLPLVLADGEVPTYNNGEAACQLGIEAAGDLPVLFGDTFLRSAYVVYDLDNNRIALAQTDFNATRSNVVAFPSRGAAIPSATSAANEAQVTQTATGIPKEGNTVTATGAGGSATYNPDAVGLSAASGFAATSTSTSTSSSSSKKSVGGEGPRPFQYSTVIVGLISMLGMGIGGGIFALL